MDFEAFRRAAGGGGEGKRLGGIVYAQKYAASAGRSVINVTIAKGKRARPWRPRASRACRGASGNFSINTRTSSHLHSSIPSASRRLLLALTPRATASYAALALIIDRPALYVLSASGRQTLRIIPVSRAHDRIVYPDHLRLACSHW